VLARPPWEPAELSLFGVRSECSHVAAVPDAGGSRAPGEEGTGHGTGLGDGSMQDSVRGLVHARRCHLARAAAQIMVMAGSWLS
jgi:hypothetical protein